MMPWHLEKGYVLGTTGDSPFCYQSSVHITDHKLVHGYASSTHLRTEIT